MKNPSFLEDDGKYFYNEDDFMSDFHRVVFSCINNLYQMGAKKVTILDIENYLSTRSESKQIYLAGKGSEWLTETVANADVANFDYYYDRMKKMTLLRSYESCGMDVKFLYDPDNIFDDKKKKEQEDYIDSLSLNEMADLIDNKILDIRAKYVDNATDESTQIGDSIFDLLDSLSKEPDMGKPMYGKYVNTVTRGCRLKKVYLRSGATGQGKSRTMIADACYLACDRMYDKLSDSWIEIGDQNPVTFISTELELSELQTMALAFIADVNEEHILSHRYDFNEYERVQQAAQILNKSPIYIEELPDFNLRDIENTIKRNIRINECQYVFLDYIHTSMKILEEISNRSGGVKLREDNILFLLGVKLKDLANQFGVFILSGTQLNADYKTSDTPDQNLLRGAKSLGDKIDVGMILLEVTKEDQEAIQGIVESQGYIMPNVKMSIYKNRRGSYNRLYLWMNADKGTCRFNPIFATDFQYTPIPMKDINIKMKSQEV
jgi:replicative DNA helicase